MPAPVIALIVVVAGIAAALLLIILIGRPKAVLPDAVPAPRILERVAAEGSLRTDSWQLEPSHRAPDVPYTPEQAHAEMQRHRECGSDLCPAKHAAFWTLVDAGQAVPDARAIR